MVSVLVCDLLAYLGIRFWESNLGIKLRVWSTTAQGNLTVPGKNMFVMAAAVPVSAD